MNPTTLRIILAIGGLAFLAALYFWERHRAQPKTAQRRAKSRTRTRASKPKPVVAKAAAASKKPAPKKKVAAAKREPNLGMLEMSESNDQDERDTPKGFAQLWSKMRNKDDHLEEDALVDDTPPPRLEPLLVQLFVITRSEPIAGTELLAAAERHQLFPGAQDIFYCYDIEDETEPVLFSVANLVHPGTFPFDSDMAEFHCPGLALFAEFPGAPHDHQRLDVMLDTATALAAEFDALIEDEQHRPLTSSHTKWMRQRVRDLQHHAKVTN